MIEAQIPYLFNELSEVARLFEGAESLDIRHQTEAREGVFYNRFTVNGELFTFENRAQAQGETEYKRYIKRFSKLALYRILSAHFQKQLPWGALTGIRPTRLAYGELERGKPFEPLFREMGVSEENISLISRVIEGQKGIYERKEGNCDLFVSLPFCPSKCVYCSFITAPIAATRKYLPDYLTAIERELEQLPPVQNLRSVYIGGGTPFALEADELERVLKAVSRVRRQECEYTVEAGRPDVFTREKLELCKEYGVTRICINAQSFSNQTLRAIGRNHTAEQVKEAFETARPYGFSINCDLIAGLTGESAESFVNSVKEAIALSPENITVHTLCLKKGAKLKEEVACLQEGRLSEMIARSRELLTQAGYEPYYLYRQKYMAGAHENVGWTKRGCASVYNIDVMEESADNLAVGGNAISKKVFLGEGRIERLGSPKDIPSYLAKTDELIKEKKKLFV